MIIPAIPVLIGVVFIVAAVVGGILGFVIFGIATRNLTAAIDGAVFLAELTLIGAAVALIGSTLFGKRIPFRR